MPRRVVQQRLRSPSTAAPRARLRPGKAPSWQFDAVQWHSVQEEPLRLAVCDGVEAQPLGRKSGRFEAEATGCVLDERHREAGIGVGHHKLRPARIDAYARSLLAMRAVPSDKRSIGRWRSRCRRRASANEGRVAFDHLRYRTQRAAKEEKGPRTGRCQMSAPSLDRKSTRLNS